MNGDYSGCHHGYVSSLQHSFSFGTFSNRIEYWIFYDEKYLGYGFLESLVRNARLQYTRGYEGIGAEPTKCWTVPWL